MTLLPSDSAGARHKQRPDRIIDRGKLDVRSQGAIRLRDRGAGLAERFEPIHLTATWFHPRDDSERRQPGEGAHLIGTLQRVVEVGVDEADRTCPDQRGNRCQECGGERARADG